MHFEAVYKGFLFIVVVATVVVPVSCTERLFIFGKKFGMLRGSCALESKKHSS